MNSHSYIGIGSVIVFAVLFILYKKSIPHEIILLSRLVHFKSGAAAISPEKRGFQAGAGERVPPLSLPSSHRVWRTAGSWAGGPAAAEGIAPRCPSPGAASASDPR